MGDRILLGGLVLSFALFITFLIATVFGIAKRPPRIRALFSILMPPLAVYYGYREGFRVRAIALGVSFSLYLVLRLLSLF